MKNKKEGNEIQKLQVGKVGGNWFGGRPQGVQL